MNVAHKGLDDWLRQGRPEPVPPELETHLSGCDSCRKSLADAEETRGWFPEPAEALPPDAVDAMRFRLQAAAREASRSERPGPAAGRRIWPVLAAAASIGAVGLASWLLLGRGEPPVTGSRSTGTVASVQPEPGARVRQIAALPDETHELSHGSAWFSVRRLSKGQRFRVIVGADIVEVRGTRFRLRADRGRLDLAEVASGRVRVRLAGGETFDLSAGQSWRRPASREPEALPRVTDGAQLTGHESAPTPPPTRQQAPRPRVARPEQSEASPALPENRVDTGFQSAWQLYRAGRSDAAALAFDMLLQQGGAGARRPDLLYWSGRAHMQAGRPGLARSRFEDLLRESPSSWHAPDARALLDRLGGEKSP